MYVPVIRKIINKNDSFIERPLPSRGEINVKVGDTVKPFDQIGSCRVSYDLVQYPSNFCPDPKIVDAPKVLQGDIIGYIKRTSVIAPYDGYLSYDYSKNFWQFKESTKDYILLSAVWGTIHDIVLEKSVLIKSCFKEILLPISFGEMSGGELVVFPNPSELLIGSFIENFTKDMSGKIFYIGGHISINTIQKASELNLKTLLAGSISKKAYAFAKNNNINICIFDGFGNLQTSRIIFNELKNISNRYVFFNPNENILRIPMPEKLDQVNVLTSFRYLKEGDMVQIFQDPYFGNIANVDTILESSILVRIPKNSKLVKVNLPNFYIIV